MNEGKSVQLNELSLTEERLGFQSNIRKTLFGSLSLPLTVAVAGCVSKVNPDHQGMIHEMGSQVMPFDLHKTKHVFRMTDNGGIQQVIVTDQKDSEEKST